MLIDWFTVVAQAINFLILVWLLKQFLYKPILDAIDAREERIARELADADAKRNEARQERDEFERKNEEFDQQRAAMLHEMTDEMDATRQRLLDEARHAADELGTRRGHELQREQQAFSAEIGRRAREEVFAITRKTLKDLADASLEERIADVFVRRVLALNGDAKQEMVKALAESTEPVTVRSAFELPEKQRSAIQQALEETFATNVQVQFETAPDAIGGIELIGNGHKVAWSIADYLKSLEKSIGAVTLRQDNSQPKPSAKVESAS
jgi:F-type H+-transporting ATPase subunit b